MNRIEINYIEIKAWPDLEPFQDSIVAYNQAAFFPENYYRIPNSSLPFFGYVSKNAYELNGQAGYFLNPLCLGNRGEATLAIVNSYIQTRRPFYMTFANEQQINDIVTSLHEQRARFATPIREEDLREIVEKNVLEHFANNKFTITLELVSSYIQARRALYETLPNRAQLTMIVNTINRESSNNLLRGNPKTDKELIETVLEGFLTVKQIH